MIQAQNYGNETCCDVYCPCCPKCNCDCSCNCNCTKKKMIIPTFILSSISFILIIVEMITKVTDTDSFTRFKNTEKTELTNYEKYKYEIDEILDIEDAEDQYSLALLIISIFIFFIYLILLICFIHEKTCFARYNPKCKQPYYMLMVILNFIATFANSMICFVFFSYRVNSIDDYSNYEFFDSDFKKANDLNMSINIINAICYLICLIFHLITCYYLYREDGICSGCCSEFLSCISCCTACLRCLFCCCECCCCCRITAPIETRTVQVYPQNSIPAVIYVNPSSAAPNPGSQERSQFRNDMGEDLRNKIETVCRNDIYGPNYTQYQVCSICKTNFQVGQEITILPCGHIFHKNCIYNWFYNNKTCPEDGTVILN